MPTPWPVGRDMTLPERVGVVGDQPSQRLLDSVSHGREIESRKRFV
jgi:hypothetical protein